MEQTTFSYATARQLCMSIGMRIGILWSISFLCSMYAAKFVLLGNIGLLLGLYSPVSLGIQLQRIRRTCMPLSLSKAVYMAALSYFFATLCTTLIQFIYFRFIDDAMFLGQMETMMKIPEYKQLFESNGYQWEEMKDLLGSVREIVYALWMFNILISIVLTLPSALISRIGRKE